MFLLSSALLFAGGSQESSKASAGRPTEVIHFLFRAGNRVNLFQKLTDAFNRSQSKVHVQLVDSTGAEDLTTRIASGNPPDMTTQIDGRGLWPYVSAGLLKNIKSEPFIKDIRPSALVAATVNGGIYALPMDTQTWGLFYNKKLFAKAGITGIPETVSALVTDVHKLKAAGITPFAAGFATPWTIGQYLDYATSSALTPAARAHFKSFVKGDFSFQTAPDIGNIMKVFDLIINNTQPNPLDANISTQYATFASGQAAMMAQGNWSILQLRHLNPKLDMGMFPIPLTNNPKQDRFPVGYAFTVNVFKSTKVMSGITKYINFFLNSNGPAGFYYSDIGIPSANRTATVKLDPASDLLAQFMKTHRTVEEFYMLLPQGDEQELFTLASSYIANHMGDHRWLEQQMTAQLKKFSKLEQAKTKAS